MFPTLGIVVILVDTTMTMVDSPGKDKSDIWNGIRVRPDVFGLGFSIGIIFTLLVCCCIKYHNRCHCRKHCKLSTTKDQHSPSSQGAHAFWVISSQTDDYRGTSTFTTLQSKTEHKIYNSAASGVYDNPKFSEDDDIMQQRPWPHEARNSETKKISSYQEPESRHEGHKSVLCHLSKRLGDIDRRLRKNTYEKKVPMPLPRRRMEPKGGNICEDKTKDCCIDVQDRYYEQGATGFKDVHTKTQDQREQCCSREKSNEPDEDVAYIKMEEIMDFISERNRLPVKCPVINRNKTCITGAENTMCTRDRHTSDDQLHHDYVNMHLVLDMDVITFLHEVHRQKFQKELFTESDYIKMG